MNAREDEPKPMIEPVIALDIFATGVIVEPVNSNELRLTAWVDLPDEKRIVARLILPDEASRSLARDLRKVLAKGGH